MPVTKTKPVQFTNPDHPNEVIESHPSYGLVRVGRVHSVGTHLFDSDLEHREFVELTFSSACVRNDGYGRNVNRTPREKPLLTVRLSGAQWAGVVSSVGIGDGVPCTLSRIRSGDAVTLPEIEPGQTMHEKFSEDIEKRLKDKIGDIEGEVSKLGVLLDSGKLGKRELREIYASLQTQVANLPGAMAFGVEITQEAVDKVVAAGKSEVEAYVSGAAMRLGLEQMRESGGVNPPLILNLGAEK